MSARILLRKATRIEGNANIQIEVEGGRAKTARFIVPDFRGFEKIMQGRTVEHAPAMISRVCGLCSAAHQVASIKAIEKALGIEPTPGLRSLRDVVVLGEWISSHALAYFFLSMPDSVGAPGGIFELARTRPDLMGEAFALREAGQRIVRLLGRRAEHPVSLGIGRFLIPPSEQDLADVRRTAGEVRDRSIRLIERLARAPEPAERITPPPDQQVNLVVYEDGAGPESFSVYDRNGQPFLSFDPGTFEENISEMRAEWSLSKFPYLASLGFPAGIMLVGPLSRSFRPNGIAADPEIAGVGISGRLRERGDLALEHFDICRLAEIFWAAKRIIERLEGTNLSALVADGNLEGSGQGIGVIEAPRGVLVHSYLIDRGRIERVRLLVATQFNNAFINLLLHDLAAKHAVENGLSPEGERLIGRCIRLFDPCISCATH